MVRILQKRTVAFDLLLKGTIFPEGLHDRREVPMLPHKLLIDLLITNDLRTRQIPFQSLESFFDLYQLGEHVGPLVYKLLRATSRARHEKPDRGNPSFGPNSG